MLDNKNSLKCYENSLKLLKTASTNSRCAYTQACQEGLLSEGFLRLQLGRFIFGRAFFWGGGWVGLFFSTVHPAYHWSKCFTHTDWSKSVTWMTGEFFVVVLTETCGVRDYLPLYILQFSSGLHDEDFAAVWSKLCKNYLKI